MKNKNEIQEKINEVRKMYAQTFETKLLEIDKILSFLEKNWDQAQLKELHRIIHNIIGSSATFGYHKVSETAQELENIIHSLMGKDYSTEAVKKVKELIVILKSYHPL